MAPKLAMAFCRPTPVERMWGGKIVAMVLIAVGVTAASVAPKADPAER